MLQKFRQNLRQVLSKTLLLVLLLGSLFEPLTGSEPLKVYYFQRPPLYLTQADGSPSGFLVEIVKLVFTEAGIDYRFEELPALRIESLLKGTEFACGIGWFKRPERETWATFSEPIYRDLPSVALVQARKAPLLGPHPSLAALLNSGLLLGVIEGFSYGTEADQAIATLHPRTFRLVGQQSQLLMMAASGRIDYFLIGHEEARYLLEANPGLAAHLRIVSIDDATAGNNRYLMFSKGVDAPTILRMNQAIGRVKRSRAYRHLTDFSQPLKH